MIFNNIFNKKAEKKEKSVSLIKLLMSNPDDFKLEAWTEDGEIKIVIKKREVLKEEEAQ